MSLTGYFHASIIRWANDTFPDDFHHLPGARDLTIQVHPISTGNDDCLKGLVVGYNTDKKGRHIEILAWLEGGDVEVGHVMKRGKGLKLVRYEIEEDLVERMEGFVKPFCWVWRKDAVTETVLARFGALVRYYLLAKGSNKAIKGNMSSFEEQFAGACWNVAAVQDVKWVEPETPSTCESTAASVHDGEWVEGEEEMVTEPTAPCKLFRLALTADTDKFNSTTPRIPLRFRGLRRQNLWRPYPFHPRHFLQIHFYQPNPLRARRYRPTNRPQHRSSYHLL